ncbi:MAG: hypothetical protein AAGG68_03640 [Bacteroidota bacterium]
MTALTDINYLINESGERTAVIIPIKEWDSILQWYKTTTEYQELKKDLKGAFEEVKQIEKGEEAKRSLDNLFDEQK